MKKSNLRAQVTYSICLGTHFEFWNPQTSHAIKATTPRGQSSRMLRAGCVYELLVASLAHQTTLLLAHVT